MASILIVIPAFGDRVSKLTFETTHALIPALARKGIGGGVSVFSYPDIEESRNIAITAWYDTVPDSTHLLFIDADMGFPPELVLDMLTFNEPMVGAIYPKKIQPTQWVASGFGEGKFAEGRGTFMKVAGLGMGCFLIRRDAVTKMIETMPELVTTRGMDIHTAAHMLKGRILRLFKKTEHPDSGEMSEDLSFCWRWINKCGGDIWCACGHTMGHVGDYTYTDNYMDYIARKQAAGELPPQPQQEAAE